MPAFLKDLSKFYGTGERNQAGQTLEEFLEGYDPYKYRTPSCTADAVIFSCAEPLTRELRGIRLLLVTRGRAGSAAFWQDLRVDRPGWPVEAIDTTGAGDTFCGCCLHHILEWGLENLDEERLGEMLSFANAAAGLVTTRKGALRSMPEEAEVRRLLANR